MAACVYNIHGRNEPIGNRSYLISALSPDQTRKRKKRIRCSLEGICLLLRLILHVVSFYPPKQSFRCLKTCR